MRKTIGILKMYRILEHLIQHTNLLLLLLMDMPYYTVYAMLEVNQHVICFSLILDWRWANQATHPRSPRTAWSAGRTRTG